jgi:hypothetical protein
MTDELQDMKEVAIVYFKVLSGIHLKGLRKTMKTLSQDSWCPC